MKVMNIQQVTYKDTSFINVIDPQDLEMKHLRQTYEFDALHLEDYLNKTQISQIETFDKYTLVILDLPIMQSPSSESESTAIPSLVPVPGFTRNDKKSRIVTAQINFFIGKDYLVVIHEGNMQLINDIFAECQKTLKNREKYLGKGSVFLLYLLIDALIDTTFPLLNDLITTIDKIDRNLEHASTDNILENISLTRRNIVVLQTLVKPLHPLFRQVEEGKYKELDGYMRPYWANVVDHLQKISERLEDSRELLEGIGQSYESLLASRTNEIVKTLTIFSAILLPLNLVAGIYGMNIDGLPFAHATDAFFRLMTLMGLIGVTFLLFFKIRRWF